MHQIYRVIAAFAPKAVLFCPSKSRDKQKIGNPLWPVRPRGAQITRGGPYSNYRGDLMGEIKSTLEIAMEKAKAVEVSSEDRERFKREEILAKARDIFLRFTRHPNRTMSVAAEVKRGGKDTPLLKESLVEVFLEALDPSDPSERIWKGLEELGLKKSDTFRKSLANLAEEEKKAYEEQASKVERKIMESLGKSGISGNAVDVNVEGSTQWLDFLEDLKKKNAAKLQTLRQKIARAITAGDGDSPR